MNDDDDDEAHSLSRWSQEARQTASQTVCLCHWAQQVYEYLYCANYQFRVCATIQLSVWRHLVNVKCSSHNIAIFSAASVII